MSEEAPKLSQDRIGVVKATPKLKVGDDVEIVHANGERRFVPIVNIYGNSIDVRYSALSGVYTIKMYAAKKSSQETKRKVGTLNGAPLWKLADIEAVKRGLYG